MRVVIIGGGIAGLAAAYYLETRGQGRVAYTLLEREPVLGGKIVSAHERGFVVEGGPDSFITYKPQALALCRELGLENDLIGTNDAARQVYVWSRGKLHPMPDGVMLIIPTKLTPFLRSPLFSWQGKLRMGLDLVIPRAHAPADVDADESLAHFVRRRLGDEALDKIAEPMIAGIYVADAEHLSLQSTFPRFLDMEKKYGSLLRGMLAQRRAPRPPAPPANGHGNGSSAPRPPISMFMTLRGGTAQLTDAMRARCEPAALRTGAAVTRVQPMPHGYTVTLDDGATLDADAVIFATPAYVTAELVRAFDPQLAAGLAQLTYVSTATVSLGFRRSEIAHSLRGFGFVVPRSEKRQILACTWSSTKFDHRAPEGHVLLRAFIGGAHNEAQAEQTEAELVQAARAELRAMMGITAEPVLTRVYRWHKANPQYKVGHTARIAALEQRAARHPGLYLAGGAYHGVGIPDCIGDGLRVTGDILKNIEMTPQFAELTA